MQTTPRRSRNNSIASDDEVDTTSEADESVEIERRVKALQRLIPGGESMEMEKLFCETAAYIEELRGQVMMMRSLAEFIDAVAREKILLVWR